VGHSRDGCATRPFRIRSKHDPFARGLLYIVAAGLIVRVLFLALYVARSPDAFDFPDTDRYLTVADNIAAGRGPIESPSVCCGCDPGYPMLLGLGRLGGLDGEWALLWFGRIINVIAGVAGIWLVGDMGRRIFSSRAGLIAAGIFAIDPILLFFHGLVLTETVFIALLLGAYACLVRLDRQPIAWAAGAGLFLGLGILTRSSAVFLPLVLAPIGAWCAAGSVRRRALACAAILLVTALVILPNIARHHRHLGHVVLTRTGSGASLLEALGPWADGGPGMEKIDYPAVADGTGEYERDRIYRQAAIQWARAHPVEALRLAWAKLKRTWSVTINAGGYDSRWHRAAAWLTVAPVFLFAAAGAILLLRKGPRVAILLLAPAAYFTLIHMVFVGSVRYRLPAMPMLFLLAAFACDRLLDRARAAVPADGRARAR